MKTELRPKLLMIYGLVRHNGWTSEIIRRCAHEIAYPLCSSYDDRHDMAGEMVLKGLAIQGLANSKPTMSARFYFMHSALHNTAVDVIRKRGRRRTLSIDALMASVVADSDYMPDVLSALVHDGGAAATESRMTIDRLMACARPELRSALTLMAADHSQREAAEVLGCSRTTIYRDINAFRTVAGLHLMPEGGTTE